MLNRTLSFEKSDGKVIRGKLYYPQDKDRFPLVIFSHGFGSSYAELEHHAVEFTDAGIGCLFFDFCGGGYASTSDGEFEDMTVLTEKEDLLTVLDEAKKIPEAADGQIFLAGESQGGFVSAMVAKEAGQEIMGLILWYPAFVIPDDSRKRMKAGGHAAEFVFERHLGADYNKVAAEIDIDDVIRGYTGPVLILHGDRDDVVPLSYSKHAEELYRDAKLIVINGAGHGFDGDDSKQAGYESRDFVLKILKHLTAFAIP